MSTRNALRIPCCSPPKMRFFVSAVFFVSALVVACGLFGAKAFGDSTDLVLVERGRQIYQNQCAKCHGVEGKGTEDFYPDPLIGDASIGELTEIIGETMPEEDPDLCVAEDANAVANFIYQSFYSEAAQLRNRPPEIQFSRLTSSQLRNSLADLYQHFHWAPERSTEFGLSGSYFDSNRWKKDKLKLERTDAIIDFDFGREAPIEGVSAEEFYIHWSGSLRPVHTGRYEIVVRSTCSMTMKFGNRDRVLIDNHVQSEGKTEFRRSLNLIGGRQYPIYIDFTQRKRKTEQPPAMFSLRWTPPGGAEQVIPPEYLTPSAGSGTFALQAKLPPDDRTYGYDRGTRVDRQWDEAVTSAALEFGE
ncbi:MAG: PA14 domain-containing protein, partial [Planctomycetota bacterium]